jgi:hypothetical protein
VGDDVGQRLLGWLAAVLSHFLVQVASPGRGDDHDAGDDRDHHHQLPSSPSQAGQEAVQPFEPAGVGKVLALGIALAELVGHAGDDQGPERQHGDDVGVGHVAIAAHHHYLDRQGQRHRAGAATEQPDRGEQDSDP